jgi:hypothetical protein
MFILVYLLAKDIRGPDWSSTVMAKRISLINKRRRLTGVVGYQ